MPRSPDQIDPEVLAISTVIGALKGLEAEAQSRVLDYVHRKLGHQSAEASSPLRGTSEPDEPRLQNQVAPEHTDDATDDGINDLARKWMRRNGLTPSALGALFSLGVDDIELVANKVPGKSKKDRMRSVILLEGVAAYLGSGTARFTHADLKATCLHYDAYDVANSTAYMKSFASEVSGSAKAGYTLSARGLTSATEMVKALVVPNE